MTHTQTDAETEIAEVLHFWFETLRPEQWFSKDAAFDATVRSRFGALWERARDGACDHWAVTPKGLLALVIVLDQFPRNMFRGEPRSFATDARALALARRAIADGFDAGLTMHEKAFLYMPLQHSEALEDQQLSLRVTASLTEPHYHEYARAHHDIIARFGRFPHRNAVLGRESTPEELAFLQQPGSSF